MQTLIIFASKHGAAEKAVNLLNEKLNNQADICQIGSDRISDLASYDEIIIGGSIHYGRIQSGIRRFCEANLALLLHKKLGLFICCMEEGETAEKEFENAFPLELRNHANVKGIFGGEFNFKRMNFIEKYIVKRISKVNSSISRLNYNAINLFADKLAQTT